jgi:hypothetical protein
VRNKTGVEPGTSHVDSEGAWLAAYGRTLRQVFPLEEPLPEEMQSLAIAIAARALLYREMDQS